MKQFTKSRNDQFAKWRMNIKVIFMSVVGGNEFSEVDFIKNNLVGMPENKKMNYDTC